MLPENLLSTTASATQGSLSVLLVLLYGYLSRKYDLVSKEGERNMTKLGTKLLLPCLLFSEMGPSSSVASLKAYWPIPALALAFQLLSLAFALALKASGVIPAPFVPSFIFNNVTSLPLLLLESLSATGSLDGLAVGGESTEALLQRGRVYFLINALVGNLTRFALGPYLMSPGRYAEESSFLPATKSDRDQVEAVESGSGDDDGADEQANGRDADESAPLLPKRARGGRIELWVERVRRSRAGAVAKTVGGALNPPLVGGLLAIFFGMVPFLRGIVFEKGLGGWVDPVTQSLSKLGGLFSVLQMFVLGSALKTKPSEGVPKRFLALLFTWRFLAVPALSISGVWGVMKIRPGVITDPMMAFVLAMAPVGPPALTLCAIADLADITEEIEGQIARLLLLSYAVTPFISTSVAAAITVAKTVT